MPPLRTKIATIRPTRTRFPVGGLRCLETYTFFCFRDFLLGGQPKRFYTLGRAPRCDIVLDDVRVSSVHAFIESHVDGTHTLIDNDATNGLYVLRGDQIERVQRTVLHVGLFVMIGKTLLVAATADGRTPLSGFTETEFRREAYRVYGSLNVAARAVGKSRETIRRALGTRARQRKGRRRE